MYKLERIFNWNLNWNAMTIIFTGAAFGSLRIAEARWGSRDYTYQIGAI